MVFTGQDMVFDGYNFAKDLYVEYVRRPLMQPIENQYINLDTIALHRKTRRGAYHIEVDVRLIKDKRRDVTELRRHLASKLYKEKPKRLYLRDDDRFDMAILDGAIDFERFLRTGFATLTFLVFGASYGREVSPVVTNNVYNGGTDITRPVITIWPVASISRLTVSNQTTGETITLIRPMSAESTIAIGQLDDDMQYKEIVTHNGENSMGRLWYASDFIRLLPGMNEIAITGAPSATFTFWERWL